VTSSFSGTALANTFVVNSEKVAGQRLARLKFVETR